MRDDPRGFLFRSATHRSSKQLTNHPMTRHDAYYVIGKRAAAAGIRTVGVGCHSMRATGITCYMRNGGRLEVAQQIANHESPRTTRLYDRSSDEISLDEIERILI